MNRLAPVLLLLLAAYAGWQEWQAPVGRVETADYGEVSIDVAFAKRQSDVQVSGKGVVARVLPDDNKGSRHQRFILRLDSGLTVLVAHNIDLAERVAGVGKGDVVAFHGEYEWTDKGGVLHWTHDDPAGRHAAGWLEHNGVRYGGLK